MSTYPLADNSQDKTDTPVIGVLAQMWVMAIKDEKGNVLDYQQQAFHPTRQYLAASYVKWLEQTGARVVPINFHSTRRELEILFSQLNGLLLPGGDGNYPPQIKIILETAIKINENGRFFPVFATCLGLQYLSTHYAFLNGWKPDTEKGQRSSFDFLDTVRVLNESNPLTFNLPPSSLSSSSLSLSDNNTQPDQQPDRQPYATESKWYQDMPEYIRQAYQTEPITANFHNYGITTTNFNKYLSKDFINVATAYADMSINKSEADTIDKQEQDIIIPDPTDETKLIWKRHHLTHIEHKKYPLFGVQYHPERTVFEWGYTADGTQGQKIFRTRNAVLASQFTATWFSFLCRKSPNKWKDLREMNSKLIYHFPKHSFGVGIVEMYFFDQWYPRNEDGSEEDSNYVPYLRYIDGIRVNHDGDGDGDGENGKKSGLDSVQATQSTQSTQDDHTSQATQINTTATTAPVAKPVGIDPSTGQVKGESLIMPM